MDSAAYKNAYDDKEGYISDRNVIIIQDILNADLTDDAKLTKLNSVHLPNNGDEYIYDFKDILKSSSTAIIKFKKIKELLAKQQKDQQDPVMQQKIQDLEEKKKNDAKDE